MNDQAELDALPCAVIVTDTSGIILLINQFAQTAFALTGSSLPDRLEQLLPRAGQIFLQTHIMPMLRKEGSVQEIYLQMHGAVSIQIPMLINAQEGMFGDVACYRWVMMPAKHRAEFEQQLLKNRQQMQEFAKSAESDRKILQTVLDGVKDVGILALSAGGSIEFANIGAELIFGAEAQELTRSRITDWLSLPDDIRHVLSLPSELNGNTNSAAQHDVETELQLNDGRYIAVQLQLRRLAPQQTLKSLSFIVIVTDIQQRKQYQALQDNFIANISHELRTPLTSILGALKLLSFDKKSVYTPQSLKLINLTVKNADRLQQLIIDILDFSKLTAGKMCIHLQATPLAGLLKQAIDEQLHYLPEKHIRIKLSQPLSAIKIQTDVGRFLQIMSNLLSNAKKFSPAQSVIRINTDIEHGCAVVSVVDEGTGVSADFIPLLFTQFRQQNETTNREYEGTGLGLSICKQLTEAMGGEIGYKQSSEGGAIFWFTTVLAPVSDSVEYKS